MLLGKCFILKRQNPICMRKWKAGKVQFIMVLADICSCRTTKPHSLCAALALRTIPSQAFSLIFRNLENMEYTGILSSKGECLKSPPTHTQRWIFSQKLNFVLSKNENLHETLVSSPMLGDTIAWFEASWFFLAACCMTS